MHRLIIFLVSSVSFCYSAATQFIPIAINSGNPAFPFPQFQPYVNASGTLGNLATKNSVGVPHAEMEQTIRDAYRIMMNRATRPGGGVGGIDYVYFKSNPSCTEGDGYAMLGAVAMADKQTFDGLWLWIHDKAMNKVKRYSDCQESSPGYLYSALPGWTNAAGQNSATDGDVDIGMALLLAYYQWGEFMGIKDACGNQISYKQAAIDFLKGLTDTLTYVSSGSLLSGDIGIDGYFKGGDSWAELSGWATAPNIATIGLSKRVEQPGPTGQYFDYTAPAYFHEFANFLAGADSAKYAWNIFQFRRAEASSDWLIGKLYQANPKNLPVCGNVTIADTTPTFSFTGSMGEDFRLGWRTILNQLWHGKPNSSWNPSTHKVDDNRGNSYELDMAKRYALYLGDSRQTPWNKTCTQSTGTNPFAYWGPLMQVTDINMIGNGGNFYFLNWIPSVGSPSSVAAQDFGLMAQLYRYLDIEWDVETPGDGYLTSVPVYYHGWYRLLGLLVLSGNYQSPSAIKPTANTKVYLAIDKTFAFDKDTVEYTVDYRNYGSLDAAGVTVVDTLHPDFVFVSATGGGTYNAASHSVTWNIGTLPGFKTATGISPTKGQVKLKIKVVNPTQKQYRNKVSIFCSNGTGWTSNEYPNHITSVMERNYLDIAKRALIIKKTASAKRIKPGSSVQVTIDFENSSDAGWINGGRPGVHFSFSQTAPNGLSTMNTMRARLFHDADEGYIDLGNYRISYFLYDSVNKCLQGSSGCTTGWQQQITIVEPDTLRSSLKVAHEMITPGQDALGKWNQRLILQFSDPTQVNRAEHLVTIDHHLSQYRGMQGRIHKGGTAPLRIVWFYNSSSWQNVTWSDDWSWDPQAAQDDAGFYFPVTNDWTDLDHPDIPVNTWNPKTCQTATHTVNNVLVEEWDGYTWRRVAGNGPMPGRDAINVTIRDTAPSGFSIAGSVTSTFGSAPVVNGRVITWTRPTLQIKEKGTITYTMIADGSCPATPDRVTVNRAWISADKESPFADSAIITISCDTVVKPPTPDHLDIILDTTAIDQLMDAPFVRITLDAGTKTAVAYAVVRDASGNNLGPATNITWTTRDPSVATVAGSGWQVTATKTGVGATFIVVSSPGLKPDSLAITTEATPLWPAIVSAIMVDNDANLVPDMLTLTLTDTFHVNQRLDSISILYRGNTYSIATNPAMLTGTVLSVPFTPLTGIDPVPTGQVTIVMTVESNEKRVSKTFTDGISPQIKSALLLENVNPLKSMVVVTFSEPVQPQRIKGQTVQGIVSGRSDTLLFLVDSSVSRGGDSVFALHAISGGTTAFSINDKIRLMPGSNGIKDAAGNTPHPQNPFVVIGKGPALATKAIYFDGNADGYADSVIVSFGRAVAAPSMVISLDWGDTRANSLGGGHLGYYRGDSTKVIVRIDSAFTKRMLRTSSAMASELFFQSFPTEKQSFWVQDSAAPVLLEAVFFPGASVASAMTPAQDTLFVRFSERAQQFGQTTPLQFLNAATGVPYSLSLLYLSENPVDFSMKFLVTSTPGTFTVADGDSVWMSIGAFGDSNNPSVVQQNQKNRRVSLQLKPANSPIVITLSQNPYTPAKPGGPLKIEVSYQSTVSFASSLQASAKIYDAMGNCVFIMDHFTPRQPNGVVGTWSGLNLMNRQVGTGTYLGVVHVWDGKGVNMVKKVLIGVKR